MNNFGFVNDAPALNLYGVAENKQKQVLWLFSPRNMSPQYKRSHLYNFTMGTFDDVSDCIEKNMTNGTNSYHNAFMFDKNNIHNAIGPSAMGSKLNTQFIQEQWTFLLMVDNESLRKRNTEFEIIPNPSFITQRDNRKIYTGICVGEPINPLNITGSPTVNPECIFYVTHQTFVNNDTRYTPHGQVIEPVVMVDVEVVQPFINTLMETEVFKLDPYSTQSVYPIALSDDYSAPTYGYSETEAMVSPSDNEVFKHRTTWNSPRHHMQKLVQGTISTLNDVRSLHEGTHHGNMFLGPDVVHDSFTHNLKNETNVDDAFFQLRSNFSFAELLQIYPALDVQTMNSPKITQMDYIDQGVTSNINRLSSLVSSVMTALLADSGLMDVSFRYHSYNPHQLDGEGIFELLNIASFTPLPHHLLERRWDVLKNKMKRLLFDSIYNDSGHFDLICHCSSGAETLSILNLLDYDAVNNSIHQTDNRLGGLNSPIIGDKQQLIHNANTMKHFTSLFVTNSQHI